MNLVPNLLYYNGIWPKIERKDHLMFTDYEINMFASYFIYYNRILLNIFHQKVCSILFKLTLIDTIYDTSIINKMQFVSFDFLSKPLKYRGAICNMGSWNL